jgi:hypothetical protein
VHARRGAAWCLEGLAGIALAEGESARAARFLAAAEAAREGLIFPIVPADHATQLERIAAARAGLGPEAFAAAWAAGRTLPLDQAIAEALESGPAPDSADTS